MPKHRWGLSLIAALVAAISPVAAAQQARAPSAAQVALLERGEPVQVLETVPQSAWPRSTVYQFIDATPEECAAVLSDYELQSKYLPRTAVSRIIRGRNAIETDVLYVIDIPLFSDERSVSRQHLSAVGGEYEIRWATVASDSAPSGSVTTGRATFAPMVNTRSGAKGTLMIHEQLVVPNSMFAKVPFVRNKAIEASRDIAAAIARQTEQERSKDEPLLQRQVARLRETLASGGGSAKLSRQP